MINEGHAQHPGYELDDDYAVFDIDTDDLTIADSDTFGFLHLTGIADPVPDDLP
ncbi:hypothetical protein LZC95_43205 [Pendulispora brunnea]|uniref:Uncharacterized protein n=1 Tax=Pendulispora brunnea TaxID=2905690 RepID=A0ABZ2K8U7_9BACT